MTDDISKSTQDSAEKPERFRRSRAARARRAAQARADAMLARLVFTLSAIAVAIVLMLGVVYWRGLAYRRRIEAGEPIDENYGAWTQDWIWGLSKMEFIGLGVIALIAVILWMRMGKRKPQD